MLDTVDDVLDEQDFTMLTEDKTEQTEAKQYPCDKCEYEAKW